MKDSEDTLGQIALTFGTMKSSKVPIPPLPRGEGESERPGEREERVMAVLRKHHRRKIWTRSARGEAF